MKNNIRNFLYGFTILFLSSPLHASIEKFFNKENYATSVMWGVLGAFAIHIAYNKYNHQEGKLSTAMYNAFPLTLQHFLDDGLHRDASGLMFIVPIFSGFFLGLNYCTSGRLLGNHVKSVGNFTKISSAFFVFPLITYFMVEWLEKEEDGGYLE